MFIGAYMFLSLFTHVYISFYKFVLVTIITISRTMQITMAVITLGVIITLVMLLTMNFLGLTD